LFFWIVEIVKREQDAIIFGKKRVEGNLNSPETIDDNFAKYSNFSFERSEKLELRHRTSSLPEIFNLVDENKKKVAKNLYSVNNFKMLTIKNTNERMLTQEKMHHNLKTQRQNKNRNLYEKRKIYSQMSRFSSEKSQERSQDRSIEINNNWLTPDMIPLQVQRVLLELHAKSKANLSKSESILDGKKFKETRLINASHNCINDASKK
jgi:hypothetical protein